MNIFNIKFSVFAVLFLLILSCKKENTEVETPINSNPFQIKYATSFSLDSVNRKLIYTIKNQKSTKEIVIDYNQLPFKKIITTSSPVVSYLEALEQTHHLVGVYDANWIYSPTLHQQIENQQTQDLGNSNGIDLEQILAINPDAVFVYSDPNKMQLYQHLEESGISVIYIDEYMDETPLGRAEYIKLFGMLMGKSQKANAIFNDIEKTYHLTQQKIKSVEKKPTVMASVMRGDVWYMPGGKSYVAQLFEDAGSNYLWKETDAEGNLHLDFEEVYTQAKDADVWVNTADITTYVALSTAHKNHDWFTAYQKGKVYSFAKRTNDAGANDYFETGTVRPDLILKDLVHIFHPEVLTEHELYFYRRLR